MGSKSKFNVLSIIVLATLGVALLMGIVGLCLDWLTVSVDTGIMGTISNSAKIGDLTEGSEGFQAAEAFAIIAVLSAAGALVSYLVSKFVNVKVLKYVTVALSVLLIVSAIITLILTFTAESMKGAKLIPAVGCWLLSVFGILGGAAGIVGAVKV